MTFQNGTIMTPEELSSLIGRNELTQADTYLSGGGDINAVDEYGRNALMYVVLDLGGVKVDSVKFLLDRGADPNIADGAQEWTPLHFAARANVLEVVEALLES